MRAAHKTKIHCVHCGGLRLANLGFMMERNLGPCKKCEGSGWINPEDREKCSECDGRGEIIQVPEWIAVRVRKLKPLLRDVRIRTTLPVEYFGHCTICNGITRFIVSVNGRLAATNSVIRKG